MASLGEQADNRAILALDTATSRAFVALASGGTIHEARSEGENSHHEELGALIRRIFNESGTSPRRLSRIVVGSGPGSFTGLRIGYSFASGLALAAGCPVAQIPTLTAMAWELKGGGQPVLALLDARREELFAALLRTSDPLEVLGPAIVPRRELEGFVGMPFNKVSFIGDVDVPGSEIARPAHLGRSLIELAVITGIGGVSAGDRELQPLYLRAVAARTIAERIQKAH